MPCLWMDAAWCPLVSPPLVASSGPHPVLEPAVPLALMALSFSCSPLAIWQVLPIFEKIGTVFLFARHEFSVKVCTCPSARLPTYLPPGAGVACSAGRPGASLGLRASCCSVGGMCGRWHRHSCWQSKCADAV